MSLRKKTLMIFGATLLTLIAVLFIPSYRLIIGSFSELEDEHAREDVQRAVDGLGDNLGQLARVTRDWASWDDTYTFIEDKNGEFIASNLELETSWINNDVNVMAFLGADGGIVYAESFDHDNEVKTIIPRDLLQHLAAGSPLLEASADEGVAGLVMLTEGPMLIASEPILTSEREGPPRGFLIWGRKLDLNETDHLAQITHLSLTTHRLDTKLPGEWGAALAGLNGSDDIYVNLLDEGSVAGYAVLKDIYGVDSLMVRVDKPRDIIGHGRSMLRYFLGMFIGATVLFGAGTFYLLERSVLSRVSKLSSDVSKIGENGDHSSRIEMTGGDELSKFASVINSTLAALEASQHELKKAHDLLEVKVQERTRELRQKVAVLQTLTEIDRQVMGMTDSRSILDLITTRAAELLHCPKAQITLAESGDSAFVAATVGMEPAANGGGEIDRLLSLNTGYEGEADVLAFGTREEVRKLLPIMTQNQNLESAAIAPLVAEGKRLGSLMVADTAPRLWNRDETQVLGLLAAEAAVSYDEARLLEEEKARRGELASMYALSRSLAETSPTVEEILELVTRQAVENIHVTFARVMLYEDGKFVVRAGFPVRTLGIDVAGFAQEDEESLPSCSRILKASHPVTINHNDASLTTRERELLFLGMATSVCIAPITADKAYGLLILGEARAESREPFSPDKIRLAQSIGDQTASALRRAELFLQLEQSYLETVFTLARAVEAKDTYTADHAERLAEMALDIGKQLSMTPGELEDLRYGAILHDVGKIGIPDEVLQKPGKLDEQEWITMKRHAEIGAEILGPVPRLARAARIVRHHHERFDGKGYPDGIEGTDIPLGARILTVVDSYSAIVDERIYKKARSSNEALTELERCSGSQFDPDIVRIFCKMMRLTAISA